jgi:hypothetical protein
MALGYQSGRRRPLILLKFAPKKYVAPAPVVEDDAGLRRLAAAVRRRLGCRDLEAGAGAQARAILGAP